MSLMQKLGLGLGAVLVMLGLASVNAWAAGPSWLVNGPRFDCEKTTEGARYKTSLECLGGERSTAEEKWERKALTGTSGKLLSDQGAEFEALATKTFVMHFGSLVTFECAAMSSTGSLVGGPPANSHVAIVFKECSVAGRSREECHVNTIGRAIGIIAINGKEEVLYIGAQAEAEKEKGQLGELLTPETGEVLTETIVNGTNCPLFSKGEQEIKGGAIGEITPVNSMGIEEKQIFPTTAIKSGYRWIKAGEVKEVSVALSLFGAIESVMSGEEKMVLESGEEWGVSRT